MTTDRNRADESAKATASEAAACDVVWPDGAIVAERVTPCYADEILRDHYYEGCVKTNFLYSFPVAGTSGTESVPRGYVPVSVLETLVDKMDAHLNHGCACTHTQEWRDELAQLARSYVPETSEKSHSKEAK